MVLLAQVPTQALPVPAVLLVARLPAPVATCLPLGKITMHRYVYLLKDVLKSRCSNVFVHAYIYNTRFYFSWKTLHFPQSWMSSSEAGPHFTKHLFVCCSESQTSGWCMLSCLVWPVFPNYVLLDVSQSFPCCFILHLAYTMIILLMIMRVEPFNRLATSFFMLTYFCVGVSHNVSLQE